MLLNDIGGNASHHAPHALLSLIRSREAYIDYKLPLPRIDEEMPTTTKVVSTSGNQSWAALCDDDDDDDDTIYPRQDGALFREHHYHDQMVAADAVEQPLMDSRGSR